MAKPKLYQGPAKNSDAGWGADPYRKERNPVLILFLIIILVFALALVAVIVRPSILE